MKIFKFIKLRKINKLKNQIVYKLFIHKLMMILKLYHLILLVVGKKLILLNLKF